eukprot:7166229-Ditylum_brightwellii.AAC.1
MRRKASTTRTQSETKERDGRREKSLLIWRAQPSILVVKTKTMTLTSTRSLPGQMRSYPTGGKRL